MRLPVLRAIALVVSVLAAAPAFVAGQPAAETISWEEVRLPGGTEAVARAAGLTTPVDRSLLLVEIVRRLHATPAGQADGAAAAMRERVNEVLGRPKPTAAPTDGGATTPAQSDLVPLRLSAAFWARAVFDGRVQEADVVRQLLMERRAALFYHGVAALDPQTTAWLTSDAARAKRLFERHAELFAAFGRSLHVEGGRVRVPGGEEAAEAWRMFVGAPVNAPDTFVELLFAKDGGRRLWFYDVVAHLPAAVQRHVLGAQLPTVDARIERLRALAGVFARVMPSWRLEDRPLWRPLADPAVWLSELAVRADGALAGPLTAAFVDTAFASDEPIDVRAAEAALSGGGETLDAAALAARVFADQARARERMTLTLYAQRAFADTPAGELANALAVCRGFMRAPALVLSLERMGVVRLDVVANAVRVADEVTRRGTPAALASLQGALALVEGVRLSRAIDRETATRLVGELAQTPFLELRFHEPLARWLRDTFAPAIEAGAPAAAGVTVEARVLDALAGAKPSGGVARGSRVEWEGQRYLVDVRAAERARLDAVRAAQGGPRLDDALALAFATPALVEPDPSRVEAAAGALDRAATGASSDRPAAAEDRERARQLERATADAREILRSAREGQDFRRVPRLAHTLAPVSANLLADVLTALAYAAQLPAGDGELEVRRLHVRHDFGASLRAPDARLRAPWAFAEPVSGAGAPWRLRGSLLSLDLALAPNRLRRLSDEPPAPSLHGADRAAIVATVPLVNPFDVSDASRDRIVAILARGRDRAAALARDAASARAAARAAGLSEWREEALVWRLAHDAADVEQSFSLVERLWLGEPDTASLAKLDAWGISLAGVTGQLATRVPRARAWEESAGHWGGGLLAGQMADLNLRCAQQLAEFALPAELVRGVLSVAVQDLIDRAAVASPDDWPALVAFVRDLPRSRFEDYVAALTVEGPLRPTPDEEQP